MARRFLTSIDLAKNELQNAAIQNLPSAPASPIKGQLYFDSTTNVLYWWNGTTWKSATGDAIAFGGVVTENVFGAAGNPGLATTVSRSDHQHGNPSHIAADHVNFPLSTFAPNAHYNMYGYKITNVGTPTAPTDAANKGYVDTAIAGLSWKEPVRVASTAAVSLIGSQTVDGVTVVEGDRVLCKNQALAETNGIYVVSGSTTWTRAADADSTPDIESAAVLVMEGPTNGDTGWVMTSNSVVVGTTPQLWVQFVGGIAIPNGDKGDIVVSGGGATWMIDYGVVTNAKLSTMDPLSVKGNQTGSTATPTDIPINAFATMLNGHFLRKSTEVVGDGVTTAFPYVHGLSTAPGTPSRDVSVTVYRNAAPYDEVEADVEHTNTTTVTVRFAVAPAVNEYSVVVIG